MGALIPHSGPCSEVLPASRREVCELLGVEAEDLTWCPYAGGGIMFMSRRAQIDAENLNTGATGIMKETFPGARMAIFGPAVTVLEAPPWLPEAS